MRTRVYSFTPKGRGYRVYATKTYHGNSRPVQKRRLSCLGNALTGMIIEGILRGITGSKKTKRW